MSHCPTVLGPGELWTPAVPGAGAPPQIPSGSKRGVVVLMHGINWGFPPTLVDFNVFGVQYYFQTLATNLVQDGWVVIFPEEIGDGYVTTQSAGWFNDCNQDSGKGSRLLGNIERYADHAMTLCAAVVPGAPVVFGGVSLGGFTALQIAINKTTDVAGFFAQVPAMKIWTANITPSFNVSPLTTTFSGTTITNFANPGTMQFTANPGFTAAGSLVVTSSGVPQIIRYTSIDGSFLAHGVTGGDGIVTVANGATVSQSTFTQGMDISTTALGSGGTGGLGNGSQGTPPVGYLCYETGDEAIGYANTQALGANATSAVTTHAVTGGNHQMSIADVAFMVAKNWVSGGTYVLNQIVVNAGASYINKLAVSGSTTAPGSDSTHWTAISGGPTTQGWFPTVMDPLCPATH